MTDLGDFTDLQNGREVDREVSRLCAICGREFTVIICESGKYVGGHCWSDLDGHPDEETGEYWECNYCYNDVDPDEISVDLDVGCR